MVALNVLVVAFTALATTAQLLNIIDFQGHILDLAFSTVTDGNPIISQSPISQPTFNPNTQWLLEFQENGDQVQIQNALGPFLSFPTVSTSKQLEFSPAASSQKFPLTFNFNITDSGGIVFTEVNTGLALTSWLAVTDINTVAPVTYAPFTPGAEQQIFTLGTPA